MSYLVNIIKGEGSFTIDLPDTEAQPLHTRSYETAEHPRGSITEARRQGHARI